MRENQSKTPKVAVIMSTYNGEKYIREQIESIFLQKGVFVHLYVRDDGSTDSTKTILLDAQAKYKNIRLYFESNVGVGNSFMKCLYNAGEEYDFYAFSDQDDIWLSEKLTKAIELLEEKNKELYCSNQLCIDQNGNVIGMRYAAIPKYGVLDCLTNNMISGCTFVFSKKLYKVINSHKASEELLRKRIHDVWVAEIAALSDCLIYDKKSYILYRQHDNNVVGAYTDNRIMSRLKRKYKKINNPEKRNGRSALAKEIYKKFPEFRENEIIKYAAFADTFCGKLDLIKNRKLFTENSSALEFVMYVVAGLY